MIPETATASCSKLAEGRGSARASTPARDCATKVWVSVLRSRAGIRHGLYKSRSLVQPSDQYLKRHPLTRESRVAARDIALWNVGLKGCRDAVLRLSHTDEWWRGGCATIVGHPVLYARCVAERYSSDHSRAG